MARGRDGGRATSAWVDAALVDYERKGLDRLTVARTAMFVVLFCWLGLNYGRAIALENVAVFATFIGLGILGWFVLRDHPERRWAAYTFLVLDVLVLAYALLSPGRTYPDEWPWQTVLRQPSFLYALLFLALAALTFRPAMVVVSGVCIALVWAIGTYVIATRPNSLLGYADMGPDDSARQLQRYLDPHHVHIDDTVVRIVVTLLLTAILAYGAYRARRLIYDQAEAARERANLARYVAPSMVERLATADRPLGQVGSVEAAVLFADIKSFTALAEGSGPDATMSLLREFHGRMAKAVFDHGGTLDKFIGDGLMAIFGVPEPRPGDAARALACAASMLDSLDEWNAARTRSGDRLGPIRAGIGLHYGRVIMGDIGGAGRFEFAVIGDTVNVASRLERMTRELDCACVASAELIERARLEGASLAGLKPLGHRDLRGRVDRVALWSGRPLSSPSAVASAG